jgi:hypothetical protein
MARVSERPCYVPGVKGVVSLDVVLHRLRVFACRQRSVSYFVAVSKFADHFSGYPPLQYTIRPFSNHDLTDNPKDASACKRWNINMSSARQVVEHAFGCLKGQFGVLCEMPGYDMDHIYKYVESLLILHNILEGLHNNPESIDGYHGDEFDEFCQVLQACACACGVVEGPTNAETERLSGVLRRKLLLQQMLDEESDLY